MLNSVVFNPQATGIISEHFIFLFFSLSHLYTHVQYAVKGKDHNRGTSAKERYKRTRSLVPGDAFSPSTGHATFVVKRVKKREPAALLGTHGSPQIRDNDEAANRSLTTGDLTRATRLPRAVWWRMRDAIGDDDGRNTEDREKKKRNSRLAANTCVCEEASGKARARLCGQGALWERTV